MVRVYAVVIVVASGFLAGQAAPQIVPPGTPPPAEDPMMLRKPLHFPGRKEAMAMKLKQSQVILEGIALNNFDKIKAATDDLVTVCDYNEFLNAYKGEEYRFQMKTFRRSVESMAQKAKDKNMDGVAIAYQDMTQSCLKCHQAMRDNRFEIKAPLDR